jgi:phage-related protein
MSSVLSNYTLSIDQGIRTKHFGHDWEEARIDGLNAPDKAFEARRRNEQGIALERKDFPEASAVWNTQMYSKANDIFRIGTAYVVRGKLSEVLSRFNLGEGGLIPYPIYKADLVTPMEGDFFLLNFGARKNSFRPEMSEDAQKFSVVKATGLQRWDINYLNENGMVALSSSALEGADLWFEEAVYNKLFMSDALAQELIAIGMRDIFKLIECRIVEGAR